jgi:hypothetical protein
MSPLVANMGLLRLDTILGLIISLFAMIFAMIYGIVMIRMRPQFYYDHRGKLRYAYGEKPHLYPRLWS